jgi:hypothetical protein
MPVALSLIIGSCGTSGSIPGRVEQLRRDGVHPDPERAQLQVEHAGDVDQGAKRTRHHTRADACLSERMHGPPASRLAGHTGGVSNEQRSDADQLTASAIRCRMSMPGSIPPAAELICRPWGL